MKTFVVLASLLALVIANDLDCKGDSTFIKGYKLTITNHGGKLAMNFNANVIKALPQGTTVKISVVSKGKVVPCKKWVSFDHKHGTLDIFSFAKTVSSIFLSRSLTFPLSLDPATMISKTC